MYLGGYTYNGDCWKGKNHRMKICFLARPSFDRFSLALYKNMASKHNDIEACFITTDKLETQYIKNNLPAAEVYETASFIRTHSEECNLERLIEYERIYDCSPIWRYIYTDRFLIYRDYNDVITITTGLFMFFESIFQGGKIDFYYSETIATLQCFIAYLVGKKYGVKYVCQMPARGSVDTTYHYFVFDEYMHNARFDDNYLNNNYTEDELERAEKYLSDFEKNDRRPPSANLVKVVPRIDIIAFGMVVKRFIKSFDPRLNDPYSYMYYKSYKRYTRIWANTFRYWKIKKYYHYADLSKKYVYFPLHYQPEATTCVCAEKYEKQIFFIDSLAKSLPADTLLYVKEHYEQLGHRELSFYKDLKKYPNVMLISPFESSRTLIENAEVVVTLTGTAGYEAMLLRKPVILAGKIVFDNAPGIIRTDDIYGNYLECLRKWKQPVREDIIKYLCECFRSYALGNAYAQNVSKLIDENIDYLGDELYNYLSNQGGKNDLL